MPRFAPCHLLIALALAGCGGGAPKADESASGGPAQPAGEAPGLPPPTQVKVMLLGPTGKAGGTVIASDAAEGLSLAINVEGLSRGPHGVHVHTTGRCDPPGFESAGPHWNPAMRDHGLENAKGPHAGDMPNLIVGSDGKAATLQRFPGHRLMDLLDADGSAVIVHAKADDQRSDPSGESGDRILCGVLLR